MRELTEKDFWHKYNKDKDDLANESRKFFSDIFNKYRCDRDRHSRDIYLALLDTLNSVANLNRRLEARDTGE